MRLVCSLILASLIVVVPTAAHADDRALFLASTTLLPIASQAAFEAAAGGSAAVQRQYDTARDLEDAIRRAEPVSAGCHSLATVLTGFARAEVLQAEGFDRQSLTQVARAKLAAPRALGGLVSARQKCQGSRPQRSRAVRPRQIEDPASDEAFFGAVRARAPELATSATISWNGLTVERTTVEHGWVFARLLTHPGPGNLSVTFFSGSGSVISRSRSSGVWLLPSSGRIAHAAGPVDTGLSSALARAVASSSTISGVYSSDLVSGTSASWNAEAAFPAASTVKLGALAAALRTFGPRPEESSSFYDMRMLATWSSNLAANRLLTGLGGSSQRGAEIAQAELSRLGARSSTYPGPYAVGTAFVPEPPPRVSSRVTSARDLAAALFTIHSAAAGHRVARETSGLSVHEARVALALLLASEPSGDNIGMVRPALGPKMPVAQKQGWINDARLTAAIIYTTTGPRIVVICAYKPDLSLSMAQGMGQRILAVLGIKKSS